MYMRVVGLTIPALILAYGAVGAMAQDRMTPLPDQQQTQSYHMGQEGGGTIGQGGMMGGGMMGHGMTGGGAMGPPIMFRLMFALMDSDGDGTISLPEFQAAHERNFQGNGHQQRWPAYPGGDASVHARNQEVGSAAVGRSVDLLDGLHDGRRRQETIDEMRSGNWFRFGAPVASVFGPDACEGEQLPIFVEREPDHLFLVSGFSSDAYSAKLLAGTKTNCGTSASTPAPKAS